VAFPSLHQLAAIEATNAALFRRLNGLTIHNGGTGFSRVSLLLANSLAQHLVELMPDAGAFPETEVVVNGLPFGKIVWEQPPRTTCSQEIENGVQDLPQINGAWSAA
jgi:hypothetical protein